MRREMLFGWSTSLTYEAGKRKLGYDYFSHLIDEMEANGMSRLIVMVDNCHLPPLDLYNHGIAWPVRNSRLKSQVDPKAINANESTEFFSKVIKKAKRLGIEVYIEVKYLGMRGIEQGYPGIEFWNNLNGSSIHKYIDICCDNDQAHQYMRDKIEDVVRRYADIDGIVMEHPSYCTIGCSCHGSQEKFLLDTGKVIFEASEEEIIKWQNERIKWAVSDLIEVVKSIRNQIKFTMETGFSPENGNIEKFQRNRGHSIETLRDIGLDFAIPYCEGRHKEKESREIERVIEYLKPLKVYLHTTIRRNPPRGYPLPPKHPEYIKRMVRWGIEYHKKNSRFQGMSFFNEVNIPQENREAVYEAIKR